MLYRTISFSAPAAVLLFSLTALFAQSAGANSAGDEFARFVKETTGNNGASRLAGINNSARHRSVLAFSELARICDQKNLDALEANPTCKPFVDWLRANSQNLEFYLVEHPNIARERGVSALKVWAEIWKTDTASHTGFGLKMAIGQALAVSGNASDATVKQAVERYQFMKRCVREGRYFPEFQQLEPWEIRYVANTEKPISELEWCQEYLASKRPKFKPDDVGGSGYAIPYRLTNYAGVSVQTGAAYYDHKPVTFALQIEYGGVCGAISKLGSWFGISRGIPALPVGQPGHCALIYRPAPGVWKLGNAVTGWYETQEAPVLFSQWGWHPSQIFLFDDFQKNYAGARLSCLALWFSRYLENSGATPAERATVCEEGLNRNVFNYDLWAEYARVLEAKKATPVEWKRAALALAGAWKSHPFQASELLRKFTPGFLKNASDNEVPLFITSAGEAWSDPDITKTTYGMTAPAFAMLIADQLRIFGVSEKLAGAVARGNADGSLWATISKEQQASVELILQAGCYVGVKNPAVAGKIGRSYFLSTREDPVRLATMQEFFEKLIARAKTSSNNTAAIALMRMMILLAEDAGDEETIAKNTFYILQFRLENAPKDLGLWQRLMPQLLANAQGIRNVEVMTNLYLQQFGTDSGKYSEQVRKYVSGVRNAKAGR